LIVFLKVLILVFLTHSQMFEFVDVRVRQMEIKTSPVYLPLRQGAGRTWHLWAEIMHPQHAPK
jgi:uncharacterized membrane protein